MRLVNLLNLVAIFICADLMNGQTVNLRKNYTLIIPVMLPLTGTTNPIAPWGIPASELALTSINNNSEILSNYNIVLDIGDDRCADSPALQSAMKLFLNYKPTRDVSRFNSGTEFGKFLPSNMTFSKETAKQGYVVPLFLGGICSPSCTATARLPQHFNFIDVTQACNDPTLSDVKKFPNFYRFLPSLQRVSTIRVEFLQLMQWSKIGIISDALPVSYADVLTLMKAVQVENLQIVATEFFNDDPNKAVWRLKQSGARIIFATCFVSICPAMGCAALKYGIHGPKYVWIFRTATDLLSPGLFRPKGCTKQMTDEFAERSLYIGADNDGNSLNPDAAVTMEGVSLRQFQTYVDERSKGIPRNGAYAWRLFVFQGVHTASHIIHDVEVHLNKQNETLHQLIEDRSRAKELELLFKEKALTVDTRGIYGRIGFLPGTRDPYTPNIIIDQVQNGVRKTVWLYRADVARPKDRFSLVTVPQWDNPQKIAPRSHPFYQAAKFEVNKGFIIANWICSALIIAATLALEIYRKRQPILSKMHFFSIGSIHSSDLSCLSVFGSVIIQASTFAYPIEATQNNFSYFCKTTAYLILFGLAILTTAMAFKVWTARLNHYPRLHRALNKVHLSITQRVIRTWNVVMLFSIYAAILILWYTTENPPFAEQILVQLEHPTLDDTFIQASWYTCQISGQSLHWLAALLVLQGLIFVMGIASALAHRSIKYPVNSGLQEAGIFVYIIFTVCIVAILALVVVHDPNVIFGTFTAFAYSCSFTTLIIANRRPLALLLGFNDTAERFNYHTGQSANNDRRRATAISSTLQIRSTQRA